MFNVQCDHTPTLIFEKDETNYFASDIRGVGCFDGDLVLNLTGISSLPSNVPDILLEEFDIGFEEITIPWPDFGTPRVKHSFWEVLHNYTMLENYKNVCIHCEGGHGRTGTALSSLLIALEQYTAKDAVQFVREVYCHKAVEVPNQCRYLQNIDLYYNNREPFKSNRPLSYVEVEAIKERMSK